MRLLIFILFSVFIFPLSVSAADPVQGQSPKSATPKELLDLTKQLAKKLNQCPALQTASSIEISILNKTSDSIDKTPLQNYLQKHLKVSKSSSEKQNLTMVISSRVSESATEFETVYNLKATVKADDEQECDANIEFKKSGSLSP